MPRDAQPVVLWDVWFTHSQCDMDTCEGRTTDDDHWFFDTWAEAAAEIEKRLTERPAGCALDAIVDRVSMPSSEWDAMAEETVTT